MAVLGKRAAMAIDEPSIFWRSRPGRLECADLMGDRLNLLNDPEFRAMARANDRISLILTSITLVIYFGFIFLLAFNQKLGDVIGRKISENITLGMPLGVGVIVS